MGDSISVAFTLCFWFTRFWIHARKAAALLSFLTSPHDGLAGDSGTGNHDLCQTDGPEFAFANFVLCKSTAKQYRLWFHLAHCTMPLYALFSLLSSAANGTGRATVAVEFHPVVLLLWLLIVLFPVKCPDVALLACIPHEIPTHPKSFSFNVVATCAWVRSR